MKNHSQCKIANITDGTCNGADLLESITRFTIRPIRSAVSNGYPEKESGKKDANDLRII